jgi:nucleotide-binding universal stress UspA family protein
LESSFEEGSSVTPQRSLAEARAAAELAAASRPITFRIETALAHGDPIAEILRRAEADGAELIVVGRRERRNLRAAVLGSTAARLVRKSDRPILVVGGPLRPSYRHLLVAVDLPPETSRRALDMSVRLLDPDRARVDIVHALDDGSQKLLRRAGATPEELRSDRKERRASARATIHEYLSASGDSGLQWTSIVQFGDPRRLVLDAVDRRRADLLAIGTHGRSGITRVLLGSVAEHLIDTAPCDVLVARALSEQGSAPPLIRA